MMDKLFIGLVIIFSLAVLVLAINDRKFPSMIKVEFKAEGKPVTVYTDQDGIIQHAEDKQWQDRVIIGVKNLRPGDTMQCYDLYTDALTPSSYQVTSVQLP